jgi:sec-independent protein translocase protein TatA
MPNIGPLELAIVLIIALVIFGPKRLPELGRSMGRGIREFKSSVSGDKDQDEAAGKPAELEGAKQPDPAQAGQSARAGDSSEAGEPVEGEVVAERRT